MGMAAIATWSFGKGAVEKAGAILMDYGKALDAVERGINVTELDPEVDSVGLGGLPNANGVVQLDGAIMDGRDRNAGCAVAVTRTPRIISLARLVMEKSPHTMLSGDFARALAIRHGLETGDLSTEKSQMAFDRWIREGGGRGRYSHADSEDEGSSEATSHELHSHGADSESVDSHDTIGLLALDGEGDLAAGCSTSGMAFKWPGRIGDSPLIGDGLYADNGAGAAAATGDGDEIMKYCMSFMVVEMMRNGESPEQACRKTLERYLSRNKGRPRPDISLIALDRSGVTGAATLRDSFPYFIWSTEGVEEKRAVSVLEG